MSSGGGDDSRPRTSSDHPAPARVSLSALRAFENPRNGTAGLGQKWSVSFNRSLEDAQKSAEAFLNSNPDMKQLVDYVEEIKGKAMSTVDSFSKRLNSAGPMGQLGAGAGGVAGPTSPNTGMSLWPFQPGGSQNILGLPRNPSEGWLRKPPPGRSASSKGPRGTPASKPAGDEDAGADDAQSESGALVSRPGAVPRVVPPARGQRVSAGDAATSASGSPSTSAPLRVTEEESVLEGPKQLVKTTDESRAITAARDRIRRVSSAATIDGAAAAKPSFKTGGDATAIIPGASRRRASSNSRGAAPGDSGTTVAVRDGRNAASERPSDSPSSSGRGNGDQLSLRDIGDETERALTEADEGKGLGIISFGPFRFRLPLPKMGGGLAQKNEKLRSKLGSIRDKGRKMAVVTTAALPWMTGTAVNPLLRAAYLSRDGDREVTLVVPWLAKSDQRQVFPNGLTFDTPEAQAAWIKQWCSKRVGFESDFKVSFYPSRYAPEKGSILAVGDITSYIPKEESDIAILEEPEHLNWYHHGPRWTNRFNHVVGIVHTNYLDYARREDMGEIKSLILRGINNVVSRSHCHKVIKLSGAVQRMPRDLTENVHGVSPSFLKVGAERAEMDPASRFSKGMYFIGKAVWGKGYTELMDLLEKHQQRGRDPVHVDIFGTGDDMPAIQERGHASRLDVQFHGARDHLDESIHEYKVFWNPSTSDVVATTTAEALAMGKFVVVEDIPCNAFFKQFANCLTYKTPEECSVCLERALSGTPKPMTEEERYRLTWEAATQRFLSAAEIDAMGRTNLPERALDNVVAKSFNAISGVEWIRRGMGAGANTKHNPPSLTEFEPPAETGGFFDNKARADRYFTKAKPQAQAQPQPQPIAVSASSNTGGRGEAA
ncbi:unnamed protein product [Pedinophyceae sp. YPF-701]|nr:unnamed protein product [Pedinophyceae sp. YPF-701]